MRLHNLLLPVVFLLLQLSLDSCQKSSSGGYGNNTTPPVTNPGITIQLKSDSHFGSVLADGSGKTLYFFSPDANGSSACTGGCLSAWPVFYSASPAIGTGLDKADFGVITRSDGAKQTTYKGWPLYYYAGDITAADIKGDGLERIWYVAKPDYMVMLAFSQLVGNDGVLYDSTYKPGTGKTFYITDDRGITLYSFSFDKSDTNNYTKADFSNDAFWPIFQISTLQNTPSSLDKTLFSTINEFGKSQLTYKGWPVYRFGPDSLMRGNTKGISVPNPGIWPVMDEFSAAAP
jgi:predicted lipoprotein with Yx(FWY)xxD motif